MLEVELDTARFNALVTGVARLIGKDLNEEMRNQGRLLIEGSRTIPGLIDLTPPGGGGVSGMQAKRQGEAAIEADLRRIFNPLDPHEWRAFLDDEGGLRIVPSKRNNKRGASVTDLTFFLSRDEMEAFHKRLRLPSGRTRAVNRDNLIGRKYTDVSEVGFVTKGDYKWYLQKKKLDVGLLAANWLPGARELGAKQIPAFVSRHAGTGGTITIQSNPETGIVITITNRPSFAGAESAAAELDRKVQAAVNIRANALERQLPDLVRYAARKAKLGD